MLVSHYPLVNKPSSPKGVEILRVLDDIKSGKYKREISKIRFQETKAEKDLLKSKLCGYTFAGTFVTRNKVSLKKSSGLAMLDFDHVSDINETIDNINNDEYTFSSFISPSGDGIKVLVKIPPVGDDKTYKEYYNSLMEHYNKYAESDFSTVDICRFTFVSYDEDLFLNLESKTFTDKFIAKEKSIAPVTNIPLTDQDEIAERLEKWFKKNYSTTANRNNNLHCWARQFNSFGVNKTVCESYLLRYEQPDFKESEILLLINSAYKHTSDYGTASFEDSKRVKTIKEQVISGAKDEAIKNRFKDLPEANIEAEIDKHKSTLSLDEFWFYTEKEAIKMATFRFKTYLQNNNISKFYPSDESGYLYIKKDNNFIKTFDENRIKDFTLTDLEKRGEVDAYEMCASSPMTFNKNFLSMLNTSKIDIQRDTKTEAFVYYKNTALKITKDEFTEIPYSDLKGLVWENQMIDRDLSLADESDGEFKTFIWKISGENKERYYTFKSVIGYLLHGYQNEGKPPTIVFNDEMISDVPNGGSGKGLINKGIGHIKKLSTINGKGFDPSGQFAYQTVDTDTQVLLFDDIDRNFKFESLFSLITEGITIEKKGKDAIKIPFKESPKISITTNYTVKGEGGSHLRRLFEVELASYFNVNHTPEDEFGHLLFSDWDDKEWQIFDNYMLRCVQYFLKNGLVASKTINLEERKLIDATSNEFIEFMESFEWDDDKRWVKSELKDAFLVDNEELKFSKWFTTTKFNKWIKLYTDTRQDLIMIEGKSNGVKWRTISKVPF